MGLFKKRKILQFTSREKQKLQLPELFNNSLTEVSRQSSIYSNLQPSIS